MKMPKRPKFALKKKGILYQRCGQVSCVSHEHSRAEIDVQKSAKMRELSDKFWSVGAVSGGHVVVHGIGQ